MHTMKRLGALVTEIYGAEKGKEAYAEIAPLLEARISQNDTEADEPLFSEADIVLISYGDSLLEDDKAPLAVLGEFAKTHLSSAVSAIHILPFFPYSSDDGFSVIDFHAVDPALGGWDDVRGLAHDFRLMFDLVLNHISAKSGWFEAYRKQEAGFEALAIEVDPETDLSAVVRPRALPLLTEIEKANGEGAHVWTTFSADQIDLNYESVSVLKKMIEVLLHYIDEGASIIRLDAIAYLWKEIGTSCIHLPQTHAVVKLLRFVMDTCAKRGIVLTETNVPHQENISYFGDGRDEAQMVYNFTLPPLTLLSFVEGNAQALSAWAKTLRVPSDETTFFNFTASHDGIGVRPLEGIVPDEKVRLLASFVEENGGRVSYKANTDGTKSPYELNITYVDAMKREGDSLSLHAARFLASQSIALVLPGVPAVYIHSLLGSHNWEKGVAQTGRARSINREKLYRSLIERELDDRNSFRHIVFHRYTHLLAARRKEPAFHPNALFSVLDVDARVFTVLRERNGRRVLCVTNVSADEITIPFSVFGITGAQGLLGAERLTDEALLLDGYGVAWLSF